MVETNNTIREKTEQVLTPIKAELIWFALLILAIIGAYKLGVYAEKIGALEDVIFNQEVVCLPKVNTKVDVKGAEKDVNNTITVGWTKYESK